MTDRTQELIDCAGRHEFTRGWCVGYLTGVLMAVAAMLLLFTATR